jgi:hypothetical protein
MVHVKSLVHSHGHRTDKTIISMSVTAHLVMHRTGTSRDMACHLCGKNSELWGMSLARCDSQEDASQTGDNKGKFFQCGPSWLFLDGPIWSPGLSSDTCHSGRACAKENG